MSEVLQLLVVFSLGHLCARVCLLQLLILGVHVFKLLSVVLNLILQSGYTLLQLNLLVRRQVDLRHLLILEELLRIINGRGVQDLEIGGRSWSASTSRVLIRHEVASLCETKVLRHLSYLSLERVNFLF